MVAVIAGGIRSCANTQSTHRNEVHTSGRRCNAALAAPPGSLRAGTKAGDAVSTHGEKRNVHSRLLRQLLPCCRAAVLHAAAACRTSWQHRDAGHALLDAADDVCAQQHAGGALSAGGRRRACLSCAAAASAMHAPDVKPVTCHRGRCQKKCRWTCAPSCARSRLQPLRMQPVQRQLVRCAHDASHSRARSCGALLLVQLESARRLRAAHPSRC